MGEPHPRSRRSLVSRHRDDRYKMFPAQRAAMAASMAVSATVAIGVDERWWRGGFGVDTDTLRRRSWTNHVRVALLAQSAEHSHGKAGVVGSIPTEGSAKRSVPGPPGASHGGVAQLVRASGS